MAKATMVRKAPPPKDQRKRKISKGPLPVTLLSGFLGSGKTTLLQHVLTRDHGLRIAVVVNDIGAVNVDASLIRKTHKVTKTNEKVISMQNGCICCTLRGDLVEELLNISKVQKFDYIMIESSGISEPEQVAETFDARLAEQMSIQANMTGDLDDGLVEALEQIQKAGGLDKFAKLDTAVTVIDAFTMLHDFETADLLSSRRNDVTEEDERTVSDLMVDQIEFANVIVLNKVDMVDLEKKAQLRDVLISLNPGAKIIEAVRGKIDVKEIVNTKRFNIDEAKLGSGWLQDLHAMTAREMADGRKVITPKPETEEYNVRNFVYRRHRPFHPERLWKLLRDTFILQLQHEEEDDDDDGDEEDANGQDDIQDNKATPKEDVAEEDEYEVPDNDIILANKKAHPIFKNLLRSKGGFWLATRPNQRGEWSQAGAMLTMVGDLPFFCTMDPKEYESEDGDVNKLVQHDIDMGGEWGDRRQELVFIGVSLEREKLAELLDGCLLNDEEWESWQRVMLIR
ncbi:GTPase, G3E family [Geosmithia morbida]|uniref:GTPase, G3E family n=1 Tax=Geosmithia morbida TaxID=1094350 RepID=A0A9P4YTV6_9HYPO|nr:GTPase, G3E family [Geosmithia morbida]KAF4120929.1 GTPase, G3E family [Geosmithia morbida]